MLDIESFNTALKMTWVKKYLDKENHSKWEIFFDLEVKSNGESTVLTGNLNKKDINKLYCFSDPFLKEMIQILSKYHIKRTAPVTTSVA